MIMFKRFSLKICAALFFFACNPSAESTSKTETKTVQKEIQGDFQATHIINKRFVPLPFYQDNGEKFMIQEYQSVEVLEDAGKRWKIRLSMEEETLEGEISKLSENGSSILVYLREYDEAARGKKTPCYEVRVKSGKVVTFRNRPLSKEELDLIKEDRKGEVAVALNKETTIFSIQKGVRVDLIEDLDLWYKVRVHTRNFVQEGYIARRSNGKNTLKDWCK